ncbi:NAD(P)/FAD-dependent oxidoreductase [Thermoflexibacter ruber]|uniref:NADH:ubiquinone reductase (non-electrogenic) n=1 Tax=Thermoflexibacter ruber TaxID=1003 RepID=A0A1I2JR45_9BACT|nr:NAD(P)/FAD-dependent oxidoreductase [Thermoflexibacter ruber]SFF57054.1 NADH dehydrogenase [Thermoflexibacter ruber]
MPYQDLQIHGAVAMHIPELNIPRVVIIGGGFAGLNLAKRLLGKGLQIVMLDRYNYHTFQPLLYQVATAGLEPDSIAGPLRKLFKEEENFFFRLALVQKIIPESNTIETSIGNLTYDYLVIATGAKTNYFGNEKIANAVFPMKQLPQALDLRSHILQNFEKATLVKDYDEKQSLMDFVIVGGGPTGVELAGALGELKLHVLPLDYPELDFRQMDIHLIDGNDRLLKGMSEVASKKALKYLERFSVNVWLNTTVTDYDGREVTLSNGKKIITRTVIWAAGIIGNLIEGIPKEAITRGNRILTNEYNQVVGFENIFAIGDIAFTKSEKYPNGHPQVAQVAIQQGKTLAKNLISMIKKKGKMKPFEYKDLGSMATVGRNRAVVDLPKWKFQGMFAWFVWLFVHLIAIVGFRNKIIILLNWFWNYFTYDRATRLIIRPFFREKMQNMSDSYFK